MSGSKYVSSFIGFAPADDPSIVIAVVLDEPQGALRNGGQVSAPIFREIAEQTLPELNIVPDETIHPDNLTAQEIPIEIEIAPISTQKKDAPKKAEKTATSKKIKETKRENKPPSEEKKSIKQKAVMLNNENKDKLSRERIKQKT